MSNVIVIGGGAAGMMAAYAAALCGHQVKLMEQNEKLGKKIFITGKGRCNITNAGDMDNLFANVMSNPKFLYSAFYTFNNEQMVGFLEEYGLKMKVERGNRVFPVSDHSSDVIATLRKALEDKNVEVFLHTKVDHLLVSGCQMEEKYRRMWSLLQQVAFHIRQPVRPETDTGSQRKPVTNWYKEPLLWFLLRLKRIG